MCVWPSRAQVVPLLWFGDHTQTHIHRRIPLDEWSARRTGRYIHNTQQTQDKDIHAPGGIRTRNPTKRTTADLRLSSRGHRDLPPTCMESEIFNSDQAVCMLSFFWCFIPNFCKRFSYVRRDRENVSRNDKYAFKVRL